MLYKYLRVWIDRSSKRTTGLYVVSINRDPYEKSHIKRFDFFLLLVYARLNLGWVTYLSGGKPIPF